jgi:uncharacterized membrane protein
MLMNRKLAAFVLAGVLFAGMDAVWLTTAYPHIYLPNVGALLRSGPDPVASVAFYLIYLAGMTHFCLAPGLDTKDVMAPVRSGALFGLFTYATYDLTNMATLRSWSWVVTLVDMGWGIFATALTSGLSVFLIRRFVKTQGSDR